MKALVLREAGCGPGALCLETVEDPVPGAGEVIVRVRAAALNHRDLFITRGQYAGLDVAPAAGIDNGRFPIVLGNDGVGEVAALGTGVEDVRTGDRVVINPALDWGNDPRPQGPRFRILGLPNNGTFAEFVKVAAANVFPRPAHLSDQSAAALALGGLTAYRAVVTRGRVQRGETALVLGIGGGVATCALLIAKQSGARVPVTSGSDQKLPRARDLGADGGFNYKTADWVKQVREATEGLGPDLIVAGTGRRDVRQGARRGAPGWRVVTYGATTGQVPRLMVRRIFWKQLDVLGSTMGAPDDFRSMLNLVTASKLEHVVDRLFPLDDQVRIIVQQQR